MSNPVYQRLCETMARRGGIYPGIDIPEFFELAETLFTPQEAEVSNAMPRGFNPAEAIAAQMGKEETEIASILENMANKGLCTAARMRGTMVYGGPPFVPGIFEFQFMRGTSTEKDKKLAVLIKNYKAAFDKALGQPKPAFPMTRVIPIDRTIDAGSTIHTYDQVKTYIETYEPLAVTTCYCRHQAKLVDEADHCGKPDDVCMQFGLGAQYIIDRGMGRKISKDEAYDILLRSEEAGLVHATYNRQEIDFLCNCCSCHCVMIKKALSYPKPGRMMNSGFTPVWEEARCTACEVCLDRCPMTALAMGENDIPVLNADRCIGCGICASGCPVGAIAMVEKEGFPEPPLDRKALKEAMRGGQTLRGVS
jgi:Na+-translocating ferredoxin:NAD+ oxidoreductase subunit B